MLLGNEKRKLEEIQKALKTLRDRNKGNLTRSESRQYYDALRKALHLFEDVVIRANKAGEELSGKEGEALRKLARTAILNLGGVTDPAHISLKDYEHLIYGPFLGVSDEGGAAAIIRRAALSSPKMQVLGTGSPIQAGVAHDAERLAAVGEVAVGPEEYCDIILDCQGSILISTNVGTRLNLRYYKVRPLIRVSNGPLKKALQEATEQAKKLVEPFWRTPDGIPRPVTLFAFFRAGTTFYRRLAVLKALNETISKGDFSDPQAHKLGLLSTVRRGWNGLHTAMDSIDLACKAGIREVAIQGVVRWEAEDKISMPGLLNYFSSMHVGRLLKYAAKRKVIVTPKNLVDPDTVARNVWSPLQVARNMGLHLGKYGLFPLTLEESSEVIGLVQPWSSDWSAAPVFYVDFPSVSKNEVYTEKNIVSGAKSWLDMVAQHRAPVVLFDTADKDRGRRLLKSAPTDRVGVLTLDQVREIDRFAHKKGVKALWAGGITIPQALEFGKLKVFGIYVTTSAAAIRPVTEKYQRDPMMTAEKEITFEGVSRVKLLVEAGFLISCLREYGLTKDADDLDHKAQSFVHLAVRSSDKKRQDAVKHELSILAENAWKVHFGHMSATKN